MRYRFGSIELRVPERELLHDNLALAIEPKVFDLLVYLLEHRDRAVGRDELIAAVWGRVDVADGALAQAILRLRKTLDVTGMPAEPVRTLPRHGYRWVAATEIIAHAEGHAVNESSETEGSTDPALLSAPKPSRKPGSLLLRMSAAALLLVFVSAALIYRFDTESSPREAASTPMRVAILAPSPVAAKDETRVTGMIELLHRQVIARVPGVHVVSGAAVASVLAAQPALRDKGDRALLAALKVTRLLEVALRRDNGGVVLSGNLRSASGAVAHAEIHEQTLDAALPRFVDALFGKADSSADPPLATLVSRPVSLAEVRRLNKQGQSRDAYAMALTLHHKQPLDSEILIELASNECVLEMFDVCEKHIAELLQSTHADAKSRARAHLLRADRQMDRRQFDDAANEIEKATRALGEHADNQWQARLLLARQQLATDREQMPEALDLARRSLTLYRLAADPRGRATAQLALGDLAADAGNFDEGLASYSEAANTFESAGDLDGLARASAQSALALGHLGRFNDARNAAQRSYAAAMQQQNPLATRISLVSLAWSLLQSGQLNEARETAHRGLAMIEPLSNPQQAMRLTSLLGFIDAAGGRFRTAMTAWDTALNMANGDPFTASGLRLAIVYAALNAGDEKRAAAETRRLHQDAGNASPDSANVFADHADALLAAHRGDLKIAASLYAKVWQRARQSGTLNQQVLADYTDVLFKLGDLNTVESLLGEASLPDKEGHLVQLVRARYLLRRGQLDAAQAAFDLAVKLSAQRYSPLIDITRAELAAQRLPR